MGISGVLCPVFTMQGECWEARCWPFGRTVQLFCYLWIKQYWWQNSRFFWHVCLNVKCDFVLISVSFLYLSSMINSSNADYPTQVSPTRRALISRLQSFVRLFSTQAFCLFEAVNCPCPSSSLQPFLIYPFLPQKLINIWITAIL